MMKKTLLQTALTLALGPTALDAAAAPIIFDFATAIDTSHTTPWTVSSGGVTLTLSNPGFIPFNSSLGNFRTDGNGLYLSGRSMFNALLSFDLSFSSSVKVTAYEVGFVQDLAASTFALTGGIAGADSSANNSVQAVGTYSLSSNYNLNAAQIGHFTSNITGGPNRLSELKSLTVETIDNSVAIPEPATFALVSLGLVGMGWKSRRKETT